MTGAETVEETLKKLIASAHRFINKTRRTYWKNKEQDYEQ
jgi:hypothetical protein